MELNTIPVLVSIILISHVLEITKSTWLPSLSVDFTVFKSSISVVPSNFDNNWFSSEILPAIPPTWNVLSVSWVPGSPID